MRPPTTTSASTAPCCARGESSSGSPGDTRTLEIEVRNRLFLSAVGYSADPAAAHPGSERHDLTDPAVLAQLDGQVDHGCRFRFGGEEGHGYVETGVGAHTRYRPEEQAITTSEGA